MAKTILLDTSVLIKLDGKKTGEAVSNILEKHFQPNDEDAYISIVTCYEFARTAKNYDEVNRKAEFLRQWNYLETDAAVMKFATVYYNVLSKLSKEDDGRLCFPHMKTQFSDADIIIGATAFKLNLYIATFDAHDFPRPMFEEQFIFPLKNGKLFILRPDMDLFERKVVELYKYLPK